jgi:hypothetical protein
MLSITTSDLRLFLHVLGATVWVGGQIIFSALVPVLRRLGNDVFKPGARQLTRIIWVGFALLIATGIWNLFAVDLGSQSQAYKDDAVRQARGCCDLRSRGLDSRACRLGPGPGAVGRNNGHRGACRVDARRRPCRIANETGIAA